MFLFVGVNPITFYEPILVVFTGRFFIDPKGIFFVVIDINFELLGDSSEN
jgi:hypothetical protein